MKYFLSSFLICTFAAASDAPIANSRLGDGLVAHARLSDGLVAHARLAYSLGTIEMWSDWMPAVGGNLKQACLDISAYYNALNIPRGIFGKLVKEEPVRLTVRGLADGTHQQRLFCHLRVWVLTPEPR